MTSAALADPIAPGTRQGRVTAPECATTFVGVSGVRRDATAAVCVGGELVAVCGQERLTRVRRAGLRHGVVPNEAVSAALRIAGIRASAVTAYALAEDGCIPGGVPAVHFDHHFAHAAASFLTSPFARAAVVVCDRRSAPQVSVWRGDGRELTDQKWDWRGSGFASVYSDCATAFGFPEDQEHLFEAFARVGHEFDCDPVPDVWHSTGRSLAMEPDWRSRLATIVGPRGRLTPRLAAVASRVQARLCAPLLAFLADVRTTLNVEDLCLGGGLFHNTYFNTAIACSRVFERTFVPVSPSNAGLAIGSALAMAYRSGRRIAPAPVSPFLGPAFDDHEIKATLDNCKLSYQYLNPRDLIDETVKALQANELVGWFQGRMEWGPRALGNRSILANPLSPYVLENLNGFLRKREGHRGYGVAVCEEDLERYFCGPPSSPRMEYEYRVRTTDLLRGLLPIGSNTVRVQTVGRGSGLFRQLLEAFRRSTGAGIVVNTSLNGFREPMACTPRDAVRVFYGTGLDRLTIGQFVIRK